MSHKLLLFLLCYFSFPLLAFSQSQRAQMAYKLPERDCVVLKQKINNLIAKINGVPETSGYIIVYEGNDEMVVTDNKGKKTIRQILPRFGEIDYQINAIREMLNSLQVPVERVNVINGGFRKKFTIDFWTVPKGAEPPKPTPTLKKMKYRKEKFPAQFDPWGC